MILYFLNDAPHRDSVKINEFQHKWVESSEDEEIFFQIFIAVNI